VLATQDINRSKHYLKKFAFAIICFLLYTTSKVHANEDHRFTAGWQKSYFKKRGINALELNWKVKSKKSLFKLSVGGSKKWKTSAQEVEGDVGIHFLDELSIEFGEAYSVEKRSKNQIWAMALGYEYFHPLKSGKWWKIDWEVYPSIGVAGYFDMLVSSSLYNFNVSLVEGEEGISDTLKIPTGITDSGFQFTIPACWNFDFGIATVKTCGLFHTNTLPSVNASITFGI
jgi:hypothetical protein